MMTQLAHQPIYKRYSSANPPAECLEIRLSQAELNASQRMRTDLKAHCKDWFGVHPVTFRHLPSKMFIAARSGTEIYHIKPLGFGDVVGF